MSDRPIIIIGGGLSGCEAAWQAANRGAKVLLYEMRPSTMTPVHKTGYLSELVCSNSLGSKDPTTASGILKEELLKLSSLIMESALLSKVPAGQALAVDRERFSIHIQQRLTDHPNIALIREEVTEIPENEIVIIATGPMTSQKMADSIGRLIGEEYLYFYDAVSPIVSTESLDFGRIFRASRYGKGDNEYLNCPLSEAEYEAFWNELINARRAEEKTFEEKFFEGCLPVEEIAKRGKNTLRFGPMKPVGLTDPGIMREPYAVVQLRQENCDATYYNMVGFQTRLKWNEQKRVFRMIPGLENAEFFRLGVMHRNIFINSPKFLERTGNLRSNQNIFFAGQITGVEGYLESTAIGAICGINAANLIGGKERVRFPEATATGSLQRFINDGRIRDFQPMNINFGLFPELGERIKKRSERNMRMRDRALSELEKFLER